MSTPVLQFCQVLGNLIFQNDVGWWSYYCRVLMKWSMNRSLLITLLSVQFNQIPALKSECSLTVCIQSGTLMLLNPMQ